MTHSIISGIVATFDRDNIDTDQIIPTEYLKSIKKFGLKRMDFLSMKSVSVMNHGYQIKTKK